MGGEITFNECKKKKRSQKNMFGFEEKGQKWVEQSKIILNGYKKIWQVLVYIECNEKKNNRFLVINERK